MIPLLLIDDEADNASVNTKDEVILIQPQSTHASALYSTVLLRLRILE